MPTKRSSIPPSPKVAQRLKAILSYHGISQTDLAISLGVTPSSVSQWISGTTAISPINAARIAELLEEDVEFVMGRADKGVRGLGAALWTLETVLGGDVLRDLEAKIASDPEAFKAHVAAFSPPKPSKPNGKLRPIKKD